MIEEEAIHDGMITTDQPRRQCG